MTMRSLSFEIETVNHRLPVEHVIKTARKTYTCLGTEKDIENTALSDLYNVETGTYCRQAFLSFLLGNGLEDKYEITLQF